jgi:NAD(P) transhydrogenase subunit alpha
VPSLVPRLTRAGFEVRVEPDAGAPAGHPDDEYRAAGAEVAADAVDGAQVLLGVQPPTTGQVARLAQAAVTVSFLPTARELDLVKAMRDSGRTSLAMELVPRISRAQTMDALSSQAVVAGYRAALIAAERLPRFLPLLMTAAGTVPPARVLVLGAGVAGLQAIATMRRLGAVVSAYDVRAAAAEEVRSVGGEFIDLGLDTLEGAAGYAREMTQERADRQRELLAPHVADADALTAEQGGNVAGARPGEEYSTGGVLVWGGRNVPSQMPAQASQLYATNVVNLLLLIVDGGALRVDLADEVIAGCCVTHDGQIRHQPTGELLTTG